MNVRPAKNFRSATRAGAIVLALTCTDSVHAARMTDLDTDLRGQAVEQARAALALNHKAAHMSVDDRLQSRDVILDADGSKHVRFNRSYRGLPVIGGDFVVHSDASGKLVSVSQTLNREIELDTRASFDKREAVVNAGLDFGTDFDGVSDASLVVFARGKAAKLAYEVSFTGTDPQGGPVDMRYFVDAHDGSILDKWSMVHTKGKPGGGGGGGGSSSPAVGIGQTLLYGDVTLNTVGASGSFTMVDSTRGDGSTYDANNRSYSTAARRATLFSDSDNNWGNNSTSDRATVAADAHYGVAATWDYYQDVHGRNGIFNDGNGVKSYVHVGSGWVNAAWYQNAMYYGDGGGSYRPLVTLDIAGHEMSHGVNQATAGLYYSGDAGGLNEANSDIMGTMVEFHANNAFDAPDYLIGEGIYANNPNGTTALRYMFRPGDADGGTSYNCQPASGFGGGDPHYSSGPANHFFYLLAEGATSPAGFNYSASQLVCNGDTGVSGIGRAKSEQIWYRALSVYMTAGTTYPQARTATLNAASDLYGSGSAERAAVARAWSAVGVN